MDDAHATVQQPNLDPLSPAQVASRLERVQVQRAGFPLQRLVLLGLLGGLYIGFGGALATLVLTDGALGYGPGRLLAGLAFSLGLFMLVIGGGELFTGNNLMVLAHASGKISTPAVLRNWAVVYAANAVGAIVLALLVHASGVMTPAGLTATAIRIAEGKAALGPAMALARAMLCNILVCVAVWLSVAARSVEGKAVAIAFPVSAFVALGFEHCIANMYLLPIGMLSGADVSLADLLVNLVPVTIGNTLGGVAVGYAYHLIYASKAQQPSAEIIALPRGELSIVPCDRPVVRAVIRSLARH
jgi:formate/nitrite transporter